MELAQVEKVVGFIGTAQEVERIRYPAACNLVDYDQVRWRGLWGQLYYAVCYLLFWRDQFALTATATPARVRRKYHGATLR